MFLGIDILVLLAALIRICRLMRMQPDVKTNEKFMVLHVLVMFLICIPNF